MGLNSTTLAPLIWLVPYGALFLWLLTHALQKNISLWSRYFLVLFHVQVRLAALAVGIIFGLHGFDGGSTSTNLLIAYVILAGQGYFTLLLAAFQFLVSWENTYLAGGSWMEREAPPGTPWIMRILRNVTPTPYLLAGELPPAGPVLHLVLMGANGGMVAGGIMLSSTSFSTTGSPSSSSSFPKTLRLIGSITLLVANAFMLACNGWSMRQSRRQLGRVHGTQWLLLLVTPLLLIRGTYGIVSTVDPLFSYFRRANYNKNGMTAGFIASQYVLGVTIEFLVSVLLLATFYTSRRSPADKKQVAAVQVSYPGPLRTPVRGLRPDEFTYDPLSNSSELQLPSMRTDQPAAYSKEKVDAYV